MSENKKTDKEKIHELIQEKYVNKNIKWNTGQLKSFRGLLVGNLAVAQDKRLRKEALFFKYLDQNLFDHPGQNTGFFENEKNMEYFLNSVHCPDAELYRTLPFTPPQELPPFLTIVKAQEIMEREFLHYISLSGEKDKNEDEKSPQKTDAYVNLLFGIVIYEIFLCEFLNYLPAPDPQAYGDLFKKMDETIKRIPEFFNRQIPQSGQAAKMQKRITDEYNQLRYFLLTICSWDFYIPHIMNLYAMLRLVALIEYVKVSIGEGRTENEKNAAAVREASFWIERQNDWNKCYLFTSTDINHNLKAYYKKFADVYQKYNISSHLDPENSAQDLARIFSDCESDMSDYIASVKSRVKKTHQKKAPEKTPEKTPDETPDEDSFLITSRFAIPILLAVHAISDLQ